MIPQALITEWRSQVPWGEDAQVELDLIMSRVLLEIFEDEQAAQGLRVSRVEYEANLVGKMADRGFAQDTQPLLAPGSSFDSADAIGLVVTYSDG